MFSFSVFFLALLILTLLDHNSYAQYSHVVSRSRAVLSSLTKPSEPKRRRVDTIRRGSAYGLGTMATIALVGLDACQCTILAEPAGAKVISVRMSLGRMDRVVYKAIRQAQF